MTIFDHLESAVRTYCRAWPTTFDTASGSWLTATDGRRYLDFFSGAGALNYGHNPRPIRNAVIEYMMRDGVTHSLDMHTVAKGSFLETFDDLILRPRDLNYRVQFPGPAGSNAVEAAMKLARKATGRRTIVHLEGSFHGMSLGAMSVSGSVEQPSVRPGFTRSIPMPASADEATTVLLEALSGDGAEGPAAALLVETVQGEGGIRTLPRGWLRAAHRVCGTLGALLIVDDVQVGVGRTGDFFSFEEERVQPDLVCLSKSIGAMGLPLALLLIRPDLDVWQPGEHNGTFRGFALAFVAAESALRQYWVDSSLATSTKLQGEHVRLRLKDAIDPTVGVVRGRGLAIGIETASGAVGTETVARCFEDGLLVETCGVDGRVIKLLPPLTASDDELQRGVDTVVRALARHTDSGSSRDNASPRGAQSELQLTRRH